MNHIRKAITVFFVALVAFGGWYEGNDTVVVDDGVAQLAVTEAVYLDEIAVNPIYLAEVATTSIAEDSVFSVDRILATIMSATNGVYTFGIPTNLGKIHDAYLFQDLLVCTDENPAPANHKDRRDGADLISSTLRYRA